MKPGSPRPRSTPVLAACAAAVVGLLSAASEAQIAPSASVQNPQAPSSPFNSGANPAITAAQSGPAGQPYSVERWAEDYSYLRDPAQRNDLFDPIKYIPLNDNGDIYLSLGGQVRERYEYFNHNNFGAGPQDRDGYFLTRVMAHFDLHLGPDVRVFVEGKSATIDQRNGGPRPTDSDVFDLNEGFIDLRLPFGEGKDGFTVRVGRQDLVYGAERFVSSLDWVNTRRTFEGVKGSLLTGDNSLDLWATRPVAVFNRSPNQENYHSVFAGVYDTLRLPAVLPGANTRFELYGLSLDQTRGPARGFSPAIGVGSDTYTVGARIATLPKPWDLDIEGDYQFGRRGAKANIDAFSFAVDGGYTFADVALTPRVAMGFDMASGGSNPTGADYSTFNQLFPLAHRYFGFIDVIGRQNILDAHPTVILKPAPTVSLRGEYHLFWRQDTGDAAYNAAGGVLRAAGGSSARFIGSEVDLLLNWQIDRHLSTYIGYSHFFTGDFIDQTGAHKDIDFAYAALTYMF